LNKKRFFLPCSLILFSTTGNINLHEKARHLKLCFISLGTFCLILRGQICTKFIPTLVCGETEMATNVVLVQKETLIFFLGGWSLFVAVNTRAGESQGISNPLQKIEDL
jgi:hypothetical protein